MPKRLSAFSNVIEAPTTSFVDAGEKSPPEDAQVKDAMFSGCIDRYAG